MRVAWVALLVASSLGAADIQRLGDGRVGPVAVLSVGEPGVTVRRDHHEAVCRSAHLLSFGVPPVGCMSS